MFRSNLVGCGDGLHHVGATTGRFCLVGAATIIEAFEQAYEEIASALEIGVAVDSREEVQ